MLLALAVMFCNGACFLVAIAGGCLDVVLEAGCLCVFVLCGGVGV